MTHVARARRRPRPRPGRRRRRHSRSRRTCLEPLTTGTATPYYYNRRQSIYTYEK